MQQEQLSYSNLIYNKTLACNLYNWECSFCFNAAVSRARILKFIHAKIHIIFCLQESLFISCKIHQIFSINYIKHWDTYDCSW